MNIFSYIADKRNEHRRRILAEDLNTMTNQIKFNPFAVCLNSNETTHGFSRRITEYRIWASGNATVIRDFYRNNDDRGEQLYFWRTAPITVRKIHSGIPGLICSKMPNVLFGGGVDITADVNSGDTDKANTELGVKATAAVNDILAKINFKDCLTNAATEESWGGHSFYKLSYNGLLTPYPILETADIMSAETIKERGITTAIVFKTWYEHKTDKYRLDETYSTNEKGEATINYALYKLGTKEERVSLFAIPETQDLYEQQQKNEIDENGTITFKELYGMLAFEKPNKLPCREFPHSGYGASDFEGAVDSFDALDETYSAIFNEIRDNRTFRYYKSSMLNRDPETGKVLPDDGYTKNFLKDDTDDDQSQGANKKRDVDTIPDKTDEHEKKFLKALVTAINNAGLSPFALGITGLESINSSSDSQQERNKVTLETRSAKLNRYKVFLPKMVKQIIVFSEWLIKHAKFKIPELDGLNVESDKFDISVNFGDYIADTDKQRVEVWGSAKTSGVCSDETAVRKIHPDWTESDIQNEVNRIRFENGMSTDNPNNLPDLTGIEDNDNDGNGTDT